MLPIRILSDLGICLPFGKERWFSELLLPVVVDEMKYWTASRPPRDFWPKKASRRQKWKETTGVMREGFGSPVLPLPSITLLRIHYAEWCYSRYISKFAQFFLAKPKWEISQASCGVCKHKSNCLSTKMARPVALSLQKYPIKMTVNSGFITRKVAEIWRAFLSNICPKLAISWKSRHTIRFRLHVMFVVRRAAEKA